MSNSSNYVEFPAVELWLIPSRYHEFELIVVAK